MMPATSNQELEISKNRVPISYFLITAAGGSS